MTLVIPALLTTGTLLAVGVLTLCVRRRFLTATVCGDSMEPTLRPGDRLLVRRTKRVRAGQLVVFLYPGMPQSDPVPEGDRTLLVKRAVAVPGDRVPAEWKYPDVQKVAGTVVPPGSLVVLGDNPATSWDSRFFGFLPRERFVGVAIRHLPGQATPEAHKIAHKGPSVTPLADK